MASIMKWMGNLLGPTKGTSNGKVWAMGDIQGCYDGMMRLLGEIEFDPTVDKLWVAGDLVNRGPKSLETLEYLYSIRESVQIVLGNHDISLIAVHLGIKKSNPTIEPIMRSPMRDKLMRWLMMQPFVHHDESLGYVMVHAGIPPEFDLDMALEYSYRLQEKLQSPDVAKWLAKKMSGGIERFGIKKNRYALGGFTRMRFCHDDGTLNFEQKGTPSLKTYQQGLLPWYEISNRKKLPAKVIFGHWSTLGYIENEEVVCLDTGCVWNGKMTAKRLDVLSMQVDCHDGIAPM